MPTRGLGHREVNPLSTVWRTYIRHLFRSRQPGMPGDAHLRDRRLTAGHRVWKSLCTVRCAISLQLLARLPSLLRLRAALSLPVQFPLLFHCGLLVVPAYREQILSGRWLYFIRSFCQRNEGIELVSTVVKILILLMHGGSGSWSSAIDHIYAEPHYLA